uniref:Uncharacterized protein n=1 Tax=Rhizophora mucronata TaxID=61149 RepID=A0A2P2NTH2_RHIMU
MVFLIHPTQQRQANPSSQDQKTHLMLKCWMMCH